MCGHNYAGLGASSSPFGGYGLGLGSNGFSDCNGLSLGTYGQLANSALASNSFANNGLGLRSYNHLAQHTLPSFNGFGLGACGSVGLW
ncbi:unnamed protein product [Brachionus calyciflorus]|uniref:Uncharacterized protein n=1 Tax=Brachionus calyciflorus TaxID=104777 RepID=A0A814HU77_9BILA|nr:unnamed protein product [Brachionus calyciflorus]